MLYDMTDGSLRKVQGTTFKEEKVLERTHLQAGVRDHIEVLGPDLLALRKSSGTSRTPTGASTCCASTRPRDWWWLS